MRLCLSALHYVFQDTKRETVSSAKKNGNENADILNSKVNSFYQASIFKRVVSSISNKSRTNIINEI